MTTLNPIARAYDLARSGQFPDVQAVLRQLKAEQFEMVEQHFSGRTLRNELRALIHEAGGAPLLEAKRKR